MGKLLAPTSLLYDEDTKRILGMAPVAADGSFIIKVPPVRGLHFQFLDENGHCSRPCALWFTSCPAKCAAALAVMKPVLYYAHLWT